MLATPSSVDPPRIAFAVPRSVGPAVVRNRLRRQVRAHLADRRRVSADRLPSGAWLFAVQPSAASADRARVIADVDDCIDRLLDTDGAGR